MALGETENDRVAFGKKKEKVFLFVSFLLVGALCFEAGLLSKVWNEQAPLALTIVENAQAPHPALGKPAIVETETLPPPSPRTNESSEAVDSVNCPLVGSKNSNKYHIPSCSYAKRILPANRVCFSSPEEAEKKGYTAGCLK